MMFQVISIPQAWFAVSWHSDPVSTGSQSKRVHHRGQLGQWCVTLHIQNPAKKNEKTGIMTSIGCKRTYMLHFLVNNDSEWGPRSSLEFAQWHLYSPLCRAHDPYPLRSLEDARHLAVVTPFEQGWHGVAWATHSGYRSGDDDDDDDFILPNRSHLPRMSERILLLLDSKVPKMGKKQITKLHQKRNTPQPTYVPTVNNLCVWNLQIHRPPPSSAKLPGGVTDQKISIGGCQAYLTVWPLETWGGVHLERNLGSFCKSQYSSEAWYDMLWVMMYKYVYLCTYMLYLLKSTGVSGECFLAFSMAWNVNISQRFWSQMEIWNLKPELHDHLSSCRQLCIPCHYAILIQCLFCPISSDSSYAYFMEHN